jgi:phage-related protein (TIGR01555 family)
MNPFTGFGTGRDKTTQSVFYPDELLYPPAATNLYNFSSTARKIVSLIPEEMLREGFEIKCDDPRFAERLDEKCVALGLEGVFFDALSWGRLYGGGLIWVGLNDGRPPDYPVGKDIRSVDFLEVFDPRFAMPDGIHINDPEHWRLWGVEGGNARVHRSRILRFGGAHTDDLSRRGNKGWDYSILQALLKDIQAFDEAFHSAHIMLGDASQAVIKLKGLLAMLAGKKQEDLRTRAALLDMSRSVARALFLDEGEDFQKIATVFSGVADVLSMSAKKLSAATGIPVAVLLGESPAGLQATGAIDIRIFYDKVKASRKRTLDRPLKGLLRLIARTMGYAGDVDIEWPSLWQSSPKEEADERLVIAQSDKIYEDMGAYTPEQIAKSRWGKGEYSADMVYDPRESPTWAAQPTNVTQDPVGGKPVETAPKPFGK